MTSDIKTYHVTLADGSTLGPLSLKGVNLQLKAKKIAPSDMIWSESKENAVALSDFLAQREEEQTAKPGDLPAREKAKLPPLKKTPSPDHSPSPSDFIPAPNYAESSPTNRVLMKSPFILLSSISMILVIALLRISVALNIKDTLTLDTDLLPKMDQYNFITAIFNYFLYVLAAIAVLFFFKWLAKTVGNLALITKNRFARPKATVIINFFIPIYNLWAAYSEMRYIWNASISPEQTTYKKHSLTVAIWWLSFWGFIALFWIKSQMPTVDINTWIAYLNGDIYADVVLALFCALSMAIVNLTTIGQNDHA